LGQVQLVSLRFPKSFSRHPRKSQEDGKKLQLPPLFSSMQAKRSLWILPDNYVRRNRLDATTT
jgi:hypothetical protein